MTRRELRQQYRAKRNALSIAERERAQSQIVDQLLTYKAYAQSERVAAYVATNGEPDLLNSLGDKQVLLPVIGPHASMAFHTYTPEIPLVPNRFGIDEPQGTAVVPLEHIDLILTPLVSFDARGHRLGMGGGYYDRYLASKQPRKPFVLGIAFECQRCPGLPNEDWDIKLDAVLTESGIQEF